MALVDGLNGVQLPSRLMPKGNYNLKCTEAVVKTTKTSGGQYIQATFVVQDGEHKGKKLWHNFNIKNPNEKAQSIGLSQLKSFMHSAGKDADVLEAAADLVGLDAVASVKIKDDPVYDAKNEISSFKAPAAKPEDIAF